MFGLNSEIDFEPTDHAGLWDEEAACRILVFVSGGVSSFFRFSVAMEAGAATGLDPDTVRGRLKAELERDLRARLPEALGMVVTDEETIGMCWQPGSAPVFAWRGDALRRLGYVSLTPHGMCRLGGEPPPDGEELWRRTLREEARGSWHPGRDSNPQPPD